MSTGPAFSLDIARESDKDDRHLSTSPLTLDGTSLLIVVRIDLRWIGST
jgi:hypothetical protein